MISKVRLILIFLLKMFYIKIDYSRKILECNIEMHSKLTLERNQKYDKPEK